MKQEKTTKTTTTKQQLQQKQPNFNTFFPMVKFNYFFVFDNHYDDVT